jgi:hypothetical protein
LIPGVKTAANALEVQKHSAANETGASFPTSMPSGAVQDLGQLTQLLQLPPIMRAQIDHPGQVLQQPVEPGKGLPIRPSARLRSDMGGESFNELGRVHRKVLQRAESAATASRLAPSVSRATGAKRTGCRSFSPRDIETIGIIAAGEYVRARIGRAALAG